MDTEGWQATGHRVAESDMTEATLDTAQDAKKERCGRKIMTKAIRTSSCPNHTLGSNPIFPLSKACHILVSLRQTFFTLLPGMLLAYETRDCICSLQEDPLFDTHPSSICQSFFWQGELVFAPMKVEREFLTHSNSNF